MVSILLCCVGFYVFPEMMNRLEECNYYGIPKNMNQDGQLENGDLCETMTRQGMSNPGTSWTLQSNLQLAYTFGFGEFLRKTDMD